MKLNPCLKWSTVFFNLVILVLGLAVLGASLRLLFDPEFSNLFFQDGNYFAGHIFVAFGALMTIVGILGLIGASAENSCLIWTFFTAMLVFVIAEIACGVLIYNQQGAFQEKVHYSILKAVDRHYGNDVSNTTKLDLIQEGWKCCGTTSYTSWSRSEYGKRYMSRDHITSSSYIVPKSCCIDQASVECERVSFSEGVRDADQSKVLFQEGCGVKLVAAINTYARYTFVSITIVTLIQVVAMVLTALLGVAIRPRRGDSSRFTSRQGLNSSFASAPMLSNAESADSKRQFSSTHTINASRTSLNLEPVIMSKTSSLV